jgi:starch-binding outer membrane protein, SusD/RagB family
MVAIMILRMAGRMDAAGRSAARRTAAAAVLALAACSPSDVLDVEDPDIINPSDVQSAAGAEAVRLGALARLNTATSGAESFFQLGGLFADEWNNGDSFIARQEIDQRVITTQNNFLTDASRALHRTRLSAGQAIDLIDEYNPTAPGWQTAEMFFVQAYVENLAAENYCDGLVFSGVEDGREVYGEPITTEAAFQRALGHADDGLGRITGSTASDARVRNALAVTRGRILLNLDRPADAAAAVAAVPTDFRYEMLHSASTTSNSFWNLNNLARRYSVSTNEGTNGLDFATAGDPRVPVCTGGDTACRAIGVTRNDRDDLTQPFYVQMLWPERESSVAIVGGIEARMIEAEAQLEAGNAAAALATLNAARTTVTGLAPLADAGTAAARVDQLFRERAFWFFGRGHRVGDLRRLIRQYGRSADAVFPTGAWHKGGNYGVDVTIPVPLAESNNPNVSAAETCLDRSA